MEICVSLRLRSPNHQAIGPRRLTQFLRWGWRCIDQLSSDDVWSVERLLSAENSFREAYNLLIYARNFNKRLKMVGLVGGRGGTSWSIWLSYGDAE